MMRFGPFVLDRRTWTLSRGGETVDLSPRLVEILAHLASNHGDIITKDDLLERFWPDVHVTENTLTRAIADIRKAIGDSAEAPQYIQTLARRGYRFVGAVAESPAVGEPERATEGRSGAGTDPFRDWVDGRLALESLEESRLPEALAAFERAAAELPQYAPAHAGLANACLLAFERSRIDGAPDRNVVVRGIASARAAVALDPRLGEAWATLAHLLALGSDVENARAAARHAVAVEPGNWRHHFRLAFASWGEERLREVDRTLALMPGCAAARFLSAMVFVARGANGPAQEQAEAGAVVQSRQAEAGTLPGAGLYWMQGLLRLALSADPAHPRGHSHEEIQQSFDREIAGESSGRLYAREFGTNARIASGFARLGVDDRVGAADMFQSVLARQPAHPRAMLGQALLQGGHRSLAPVASRVEELSADGRHVDAALVGAAVQAARDDLAGAMAILDRLLTHAPPGSAGWIIPVDPMLAPLRATPGFDRLLARLAARAA
jgi:DNA-binding winged helix-turn-helix (wHTH) protein